MPGFQCISILLVVYIVISDSYAATVMPAKPAPTEAFGNVWQLDSKGNYWLFWNFNDTHVTFETHVKTKGYVGFGLSTNGKMFPADVVIGWVDSAGSAHFKDCHTEGHYAPIVDTSQDWHLILGKEDQFGTVLKFVRKLDTCDEKDRQITKDTIKVIYSFHPDDPSSFSSIPWHGAERRGAKSLMLLSSVKANEYVPPPDVETYDLVHHNFHVPATYDTHYECKVFKVPHSTQKHHMIRYEPILTPGNEPNVHHILIYNCPTATDSDVGNVYNCYQNRPKHLDCIDVVIVWAVGGVAFDFPSNAGFSFNAPGDPQYLIMETHYNNPTLKSGIIDSSGIRVYFTNNIRQYDAGMLMTGALVTRMQFIPPKEKSFLSRHYCSKDCLQKFVGSQDRSMKVFAVLLHAHLIGSAIRARHIRGETELEPFAEDMSYDFDYQDMRVLQKEREIKFGDKITVDCYYDSTGRTNPTIGGLSTRDEMCLALLYFYPKASTSVYSCRSEPFYSPMGDDVKQNVRTLYTWDWNDQSNHDKLNSILANTTFYHECGNYFDNPGANWRQQVYTEHEPAVLYTPKPRMCPAQ